MPSEAKRNGVRVPAAQRSADSVLVRCDGIAPEPQVPQDRDDLMQTRTLVRVAGV